jgi:hypothetical protein
MRGAKGCLKFDFVEEVGASRVSGSAPERRASCLAADEPLFLMCSTTGLCVVLRFG